MPSITHAPAPTALIIDDNDLTRSALRMILQGAECNVLSEAPSGKTGLEQALRLRPSIVFLDVGLRDANGLDILKAIRNALPLTAVLMVTASNDGATIRTALQSGAAGFIVKPFTLDTVERSLGKVLANIRTAASIAS